MIRTSLIFCLSYSRHTCNRSEFCSHVRFVVTNNTRWVLVITYYKFEDDHCEIRSLKLVYKRVSDGSGVISGTIIHARITQRSDTICTCSESMLLSPFTRYLCRHRTQSQRDSRKQSLRLCMALLRDMNGELGRASNSRLLLKAQGSHRSRVYP